jgi:hypothetical protein
MTRWVMCLLAWLTVSGLPWRLGLHAGDISQVLSPVSLSSHTVLRTIGVILSTVLPPFILARSAICPLSLAHVCWLALIVPHGWIPEDHPLRARALGCSGRPPARPAAQSRGCTRVSKENSRPGRA